jgi:hypothetical protein
MSISSLETIIKLDRKYVVLQAWEQQVLNACTIANPELGTSIRQSKASSDTKYKPPAHNEINTDGTRVYELKTGVNDSSVNTSSSHEATYDDKVPSVFISL